jgi:hypothetical protein
MLSDKEVLAFGECLGVGADVISHGFADGRRETRYEAELDSIWKALFRTFPPQRSCFLLKQHMVPFIDIQMDGSWRRVIPVKGRFLSVFIGNRPVRDSDSNVRRDSKGTSCLNHKGLGIYVFRGIQEPSDASGLYGLTGKRLLCHRHLEFG